MDINALPLIYQGFRAFLDFEIERVGGDAMQVFRSYSTINQQEQEQQERLTAPTEVSDTSHVMNVMARIRRCKHIKYNVKSNSLAWLRIQNTGLRMEIIKSNND